MRVVAVITSVLVMCLSGCTRNRGALIRSPDIADEHIVGLFPCEVGGRGVLDLDPARPVTVLVHGCNSSGGRFKTLASVFEASGQQTICFNYNDRDYLNTSASQLAAALSSLQRRLEPQELTVIGHSQGGLVARRALQADLPRPLTTREGFSYRLVTVSTPFAGISSSSDCGKTWLHVLSLSVTVLVCLAVTGNKWTEIPPGSAFMNNATKSIATSHLQIVTDERETCRQRRPDGTCAVDDFVFGLDEQYSPVVAGEAHTVVELRAGHAAVVGETGVAPLTLIDTLREHQILAPTPPDKQATLAQVLARLYPR